ncbi:YTH domain-containing protein 1-like isoform X1 [Olea europaea var. sylvestris]|uniref:YTH domain-containing protein 1-like isoform X1 n=2 Tax=Olea europaea var. sylvestris TaxID=158386 RepID=UPI000C1CDD36|nr:YTH domain-containing protein 1-like isoform X1 [Olea europaea var. sylvestris]XP_022892815.1 YTH domain-containing protein 1-like isoform X1 [Olea europaea var. sylvestris]XP_022892816.1 YTH domain-containing protein 1-like isoform X1 [Olea europaea var. sylvestris]XP_022892817.1 YTH domain-containing protein 1-like isoform X1 [Olea europaea var. sylvestris]
MGMANLNDPGSSTDKINEEACCLGAEEQVHSGDQVPIKDSLYKVRYFIIKSLSHENIQLSIEKGLWATQIMNEPILEEAFQNSGKVILIFSVNTSGFFQGYAQMMSSIGGRREDIWSQESGKNKPWGRSFKVKWLCLHDLPFRKTLHLKNPWNYYRPVKISRDCQELPQEIGEALCELLDGRDDVEINLTRDEARDDLYSQCLYKEQLHSFQNEDCNVPPLHMEPALDPFFLYQHQAEVNRYHLAHIRKNGLSAERSPHAFTLTEDDILKMTYEEYLEAHSRGYRWPPDPAAGTSESVQKSSSSKKISDDSQLSCSSKKRKRH